MADTPDAPAVQAPLPIAKASDSAPIVFGDGVAAYGFCNGVAEIELSARIPVAMSNGITRADTIIVAHIRLSSSGLSQFKDAIQKIETLLAPSDAKPN